MWERLCPSVGEGVSQCERACPSVVGCALLHNLEFTFSCQPYPYGTSSCTFRLMMSLAPSDLVRGVSSVRACVQVWEGVFQCERVSQCERVCHSVRGCATVWEDVPQCVRVCPSVGWCVPV